MPSSTVYTSLVDDLARNNVNFSSDTFKMMLVTGYTPSKNHTKRNDITAYQVTGTGYTAGGNAATASLTLDTTNNKEVVNFTITSWTSATISAAGGVIYKARGGVDTADNLVGYVDFGGTVTSTNGTFAVTISSGLTFQN